MGLFSHKKKPAKPHKRKTSLNSKIRKTNRGLRGLAKLFKALSKEGKRY